MLYLPLKEAYEDIWEWYIKPNFDIWEPAEYSELAELAELELVTQVLLMY